MNVDAVREGQGGQGEGLQQGQELRHQEHVAAIEAIYPNAGDGREALIETTRPELIPACVALLAHPDDERHSAIVGGETVDEPASGQAGHPGADKGDGLASEEQPKVWVAQGAEGM